MDFIIRKGRLPGYAEPMDIGISDGILREIKKGIAKRATDELNADGKLILPGFVDSHVHMDKAMSVTPQSFRHGSILERVQHLNTLKKSFNKENVCERATALAKIFARRGILNVRTDVDVDLVVGLKGVEGILETKKRCKDFINIQIFAFAQEGIINHPEVAGLLERALEMGADGVAGHTSIEAQGKKHVNAIIRIAEKHEVDVDFHVDENADPDNSLLEYVISMVTSEGYSGRTNAIHCATLGVVTSDDAIRLSEKMAEAGVNVTICPGTKVLDLPLAPAQILTKSGVNVSLGSDNIRDPINPLGSGNPLVLGAMLSHWQKLLNEEELLSLVSMVTENGARTLGIKDTYGLTVGNPADLVILDCGTPVDAVLDVPQIVEIFKNGKKISESITF
jgi:cytosine deaminase